MRRRLSIAILFFLAACGGEEKVEAPASAPEPATVQQLAPFPFEGKWANSFTDCSLDPGSVENAPIFIGTNRFVAYKNECMLTNITVLDELNGRYEVSRKCLTEGEAYNDQAIFRVSGETLMMQSDVGSVTWLRCSASEGTQ